MSDDVDLRMVSGVFECFQLGDDSGASELSLAKKNIRVHSLVSLWGWFLSHYCLELTVPGVLDIAIILLRNLNLKTTRETTVKLPDSPSLTLVQL